MTPDPINMAKGIANGSPISACTDTAKIGDAFAPDDHLSTFWGNPVCTAVALANINMVREKLPQKAAEESEFIMGRLNEMKEKHKIIGDIRGKELMIGRRTSKRRKEDTS